LAATAPEDLMAREREAKFVKRRQLTQQENTGSSKDKTFERWQRRIGDATTGEWTRLFIGDIRAWCDRPHGQLTFHLTQILSNHGCFGEYLWKIGKEETPACHHCQADKDAARHTLLCCNAWDVERTTLARELGGTADTRSLIEAAIRDRSCWTALETYARVVMGAKEAAERIRRGEQLAIL